MKWQEFVKDFIGDNEVVEVKASSLKKMLLDNENMMKLLDGKDKQIEMQRRVIDTLKQQLVWEDAKKPRFIDLEA